MRHLWRAKYKDETILAWQMAQICLNVYLKELILSFFFAVLHEFDMEVIKRLWYHRQYVSIIYSALSTKSTMHLNHVFIAPYKTAVTGFKKHDLVWTDKITELRGEICQSLVFFYIRPLDQADSVHHNICVCTVYLVIWALRWLLKYYGVGKVLGVN